MCLKLRQALCGQDPVAQLLCGVINAKAAKLRSAAGGSDGDGGNDAADDGSDGVEIITMTVRG